MTPHDLLANFETLAEAPNGIQRLRELVLELAVRGKLVEQDPGEESAIDLLKQIRAEKTRLIASAAIRSGKHLPEVGQGEAPFEIPPTWRWSRLRSITRDLGQKVPDAPFSYIDVGSIDNQGGQITGSPDVLGPSEAPSRARKLVSLGTVIFSTVRPYLMNIAIVKKEFDPSPIVSTAFAVLHPFQGIDSTFLFWVLRSPFFMAWVGERAKGVAYPAISDGDLQFAPIPVPPTPEQHRIVARVDELMALLDRLEAKRQKREAARTAARDSALAALREAPTPDDVETAWLRIQERFHELFATPEDVEECRHTISDLAVRGMLVPQSSDDGDAAQALLSILETNPSTRISGRGKRSFETEPIAENEVPLQIPAGWTWVRLSTLGQTFDYGTSEKAHPEPVGFPVLRMNNIQQGKVCLDNLKYIEDDNGELQNLLMLHGDLLFNRTNSYELVGKTGVFLGEDNKYTFASYLIRIRLIDNIALPEYVNLYLNSSICRLSQIEPHITQQTGQANFNGTKLKAILLPLPTIQEQKRIIARVQYLFALVTNFASALEVKRGIAATFAAAAVHHLDA